MSSLKKLEVPVTLDEMDCLPVYSTVSAAGADVKAFIQEPLILTSGASTMIPTGIRLAIPDGFEVQIRPRSGLAAKHGITVLNTPGTIDSDYRGELQIILINHSKTDFTITPGMRIAQMILAPVIQMEFVIAEELSLTARNTGGFGHTGTH